MSEEKDIAVEAKVLADQNHRIYGTALSESLANLVDDLADEVERHRAIMEMRLDKETLLKYFHVEEGAMDIAVNPPEFIRKLLAVLLLTAMDDAPNFQTACLTWKADNYELTIRKIDGKSPAQMLAELRSENETLKQRLVEWQSNASSLERQT